LYTLFRSKSGKPRVFEYPHLPIILKNSGNFKEKTG